MQSLRPPRRRRPLHLGVLTRRNNLGISCNNAACPQASGGTTLPAPQPPAQRPGSAPSSSPTPFATESLGLTAPLGALSFAKTQGVGCNLKAP